MKINSSQLRFILENTPAEQNIMLVGKHGIGKSRILEDFFEERGEKVVTLFLGQMSDPGDLIGLPHLDETTGRTEFMLPYWFPTDGQPVVLFLDELNRARPEVLQTVMDLTLNRKLAGKSLPKGSRIISAVNGGNEYQLTDLDPALVSRFNIYEFAPSVEDWLEWARGASLDSRIISFIDENPEFLDGDENYNSENLERSPDRRSWERTSKVIEKFPKLDELVQSMVSGIVGNRATASFFEFVNSHHIPSMGNLLGGDLSKATTLLSDLSFTEFTQLNEAIFRWLEKNASSADLSVASNLNVYYDWLGSNNKKELQSHFASLVSAERYPAALNFIVEKAPSLYEKLLNLCS
ncbi:AAA domain (dynein-related subfamily) [Treponema bryantii]|uniref:AAA domain (Dynein-related subfamily) n=1 Tax=Treponema bryantii TaxID=163 RepID=A0A1I3JHR7_9SPIR|nr:AAA family ATPase [Treponema bryantii]SFI59660.1 AAA domain (dynein-related subfamily) [Treponema bryantii]